MVVPYHRWAYILSSLCSSTHDGDDEYSGYDDIIIAHSNAKRWGSYSFHRKWLNFTK